MIEKMEGEVVLGPEEGGGGGQRSAQHIDAGSLVGCQSAV